VGRLSGRTALVTGAARRVGRAIALELAGEGADCLLHYNRSADDLEQTLADCRALGVRADGVRADLLDGASVDRMIREVSERAVDVLVHNASTFSRAPFLDEEPHVHREMLRRDLAIHVELPFYLGRTLGAAMAERGFGRIVLIGDWSADAAVYRHYPSYIVSKAGVPTLARVLAVELGARSPGVTVNAVLPGPIVPPDGHDPNDVAMVGRQTVLGRWLGAEEVARAVVYFTLAEGVTGAALRVDGGRAIKAL
jgi:pteridine reductase